MFKWFNYLPLFLNCLTSFFLGFGILDDGQLSRGIQTASAFGTNLTCIDIQELKHGEGNIHSGKYSENIITDLRYL
jgi:hypothetical protein